MRVPGRGADVDERGRQDSWDELGAGGESDRDARTSPILLAPSALRTETVGVLTSMQRDRGLVGILMPMPRVRVASRLLAVAAVVAPVSAPCASQGVAPVLGRYGSPDSRVTIGVGQIGLTADSTERAIANEIDVLPQGPGCESLEYDLQYSIHWNVLVPIGPGGTITYRGTIRTYRDDDGDSHPMRPLTYVVRAKWERPDVVFGSIRFTGPAHPRRQTPEGCRYHETFRLRRRIGPVVRPDVVTFTQDGRAILLRTAPDGVGWALETCVADRDASQCRTRSRARIPRGLDLVAARARDANHVRIIATTHDLRQRQWTVWRLDVRGAGRMVHRLRPIARFRAKSVAFSWRPASSIVDAIGLVGRSPTVARYRRLDLHEKPSGQAAAIDLVVNNGLATPAIASHGNQVAVAWDTVREFHGTCGKCLLPRSEIRIRTTQFAASGDGGRTFSVLDEQPEGTERDLFAYRGRPVALTRRDCCADDPRGFAVTTRGLTPLDRLPGGGFPEFADANGRAHLVTLRRRSGGEIVTYEVSQADGRLRVAARVRCDTAHYGGYAFDDQPGTGSPYANSFPTGRGGTLSVLHGWVHWLSPGRVSAPPGCALLPMPTPDSQRPREELRARHRHRLVPYWDSLAAA
jgi:hypothetical protein